MAEAIVKFSQPFHKGFNVYHSKEACLCVLQKVEVAQLPWWNERCSQFVREVEKCPIPKPKGKSVFPIISLEGLDGVGKSLITRTLAEKLRGSQHNTPPKTWDDIRALYMDEPEAISRSFYSASNYLAAASIAAAVESGPAVVDRWWASTCAMALANQCNSATLPPAGAEVYRWPEDLLCFDAGYYIYTDEKTRIGRIRARAPETAEEKRLSAKEEMRRTVAEVYQRMNMFTTIEAATYRHAVNSILSDLTKKGFAHNAVPFTTKELNEVQPF